MLHEHSPDTNVIQSWYTTQIKSNESTGEWAQFILQYIEQVDSLLCLISACRWGGYLAASENIIKYFFEHDLLNYGRLMSIYLAQMNEFENNDPVTLEAQKSEDFVVA